jgi:hypothetical protein
MTHENPICPDNTQRVLEALRLVGGEFTREAHELTRATLAASLTVLWLEFASERGQAALAAQGRGAIRLPLVIIGDTYSLQRPPFTAVSACLAALQSGYRPLVGSVIPLEDGPQARINSRGIEGKQNGVRLAGGGGRWNCDRISFAATVDR